MAAATAQKRICAICSERESEFRRCERASQLPSSSSSSGDTIQSPGMGEKETGLAEGGREMANHWDIQSMQLVREHA